MADLCTIVPAGDGTEPTLEPAEPVATTVSIAALTTSCAESFDDLTVQLRSRGQTSPVLAAVIDHESRFRLWVTTFGAYHGASDGRSIDTRLSTATEISERLMDILSEMQDDLEDAVQLTPALDDGQQPGTAATRSHDVDEISELLAIVDSISPLLESLMKVSMLDPSLVSYVFSDLGPPSGEGPPQTARISPGVTSLSGGDDAQLGSIARMAGDQRTELDLASRNSLDGLSDPPLQKTQELLESDRQVMGLVTADSLSLRSQDTLTHGQRTWSLTSSSHPSQLTLTPDDPPPYLGPVIIRANEEKVARIALASGDSSEDGVVTILKSSNNRFRIIHETTLPSLVKDKMLVTLSVDTSEYRMIPRYALPALENPANEIALVSRNEETLYTFGSFDDVCSFQTALTGYEVSHDQSGIQCQFSDQACAFDCLGRIQLWQDPTDRKEVIQRDVDLSSAPQPSSNPAPFSFRKEVTENAELPAVVIYTQLVDRKGRSRLAMLFIEMAGGLKIDPSECRCDRDYDTCSKLVLTCGRKRNFAVRVLFSDSDAHGQPDPNTFDLLPFRKPRHPRYHSLATKRTEYIVFKFDSLPEKRRFDEQLQLLSRLEEVQRGLSLQFTQSLRRSHAARPSGTSTPELPSVPSSLRSPGLSGLPNHGLGSKEVRKTGELFQEQRDLATQEGQSSIQPTSASSASSFAMNLSPSSGQRSALNSGQSPKASRQRRGFWRTFGFE